MVDSERGRFEKRTNVHCVVSKCVDQRRKKQVEIGKTHIQCAIKAVLLMVVDVFQNLALIDLGQRSNTLRRISWAESGPYDRKVL